MRIAQFSSIATNERVDSKAGIIYGVSVISIGEAVTHDVWIDSTTLEQIVELGKKAGNDGIKVKMKHEGKEANSPLISIVGALKNFRKDGENARADLHYLTSDDTFDKAMEMAQKQPKDFGLSISSKLFEIESISDKDFFRIKSLESVDLTSDPAANANGLFSKHHHGDADEKMEYEADGKTHTAKCMCKACMRKKMSQKSKTMSAIFAKALGLSETADEAEIVLALTKKLEPAKPTDLTELQKKIDTANTTLAELQKKGENAVALSKKSEIDNLMAEASRDGKVVPLDNDDLYLSKDGVITIKTEPVQLSKMISKLPKGQVAITKRSNVPVNDKNEPIQFDRRTVEGNSKVIEFCRQRREAGAISLGRAIREQSEAQN